MLPIDLEPPATRRPFAVRLGWFVLIWALSIGALGIVALLIRAMIGQH